MLFGFIQSVAAQGYPPCLHDTGDVPPSDGLSPKSWKSSLAPLRRWVCQSAIGLGLVALGSSLALAPAPARALDRIELKPSFLLENPLQLDDLVTFVETGAKNDDLQLLLDLLSGFSDVEEEEVRQFFGQTSVVDTVLLDRFLTSYVGEVVAQELSLVLDPQAGGEAQVWQSYRDAVSAAAADGELSVLEVLQNYGPELAVVDMQRFSKLQKQLSEDVEDLQALAGIDPTEASSSGLDQLFCTDQAGDENDLMMLVNNFSTTVELPAAEAMALETEVDAALFDRFITSFFGEVVLRQVVVVLAPGQEGEDRAATQEAIAAAMVQAAQDGQFSIVEALETYQPDAVESNVALMSSIVARMQQDVRDFRRLLDLDELTDLTVIIQELICGPDR